MVSKCLKKYMSKLIFCSHNLRSVWDSVISVPDDIYYAIYFFFYRFQFLTQFMFAMTLFASVAFPTENRHILEVKINRFSTDCLEILGRRQWSNVFFNCFRRGGLSSLLYLTMCLSGQGIIFIYRRQSISSWLMT